MWPDEFWPDVYWPGEYWPEDEGDKGEVELHPFGSAVGPALYEPIIGKALTE